MEPEIEAKFLDIDKDDLRQKLKNLGASCLAPERKMIRTVFKTGNPNSFTRVRNEGNKTVITYKEFTNRNSITGVQEINLEVSDYDKAVELLSSLGLRAKSYEESLRETWKFKNIEIDIDTWPWLPTYVEIEGPSVDEVKAFSKQLGFNFNNNLVGSVGKVYEQYYDIREQDLNAGLGGWSRIEFIPTPDWLSSKSRRRSN